MKTNRMKKFFSHSIVAAIILFLLNFLIVYKVTTVVGSIIWEKTGGTFIELFLILAALLCGGGIAFIGKLFMEPENFKICLICFIGVTALALAILYRLNFDYYWTAFPQFIDSVFVIPAGISCFVLLHFFNHKRRKSEHR